MAKHETEMERRVLLGLSRVLGADVQHLGEALPDIDAVVKLPKPFESDSQQRLIWLVDVKAPSKGNASFAFELGQVYLEASHAKDAKRQKDAFFRTWALVGQEDAAVFAHDFVGWTPTYFIDLKAWRTPWLADWQSVFPDTVPEDGAATLARLQALYALAQGDGDEALREHGGNAEAASKLAWKITKSPDGRPVYKHSYCARYEDDSAFKAAVLWQLEADDEDGFAVLPPLTYVDIDARLLFIHKWPSNLGWAKYVAACVEAGKELTPDVPVNTPRPPWLPDERRPVVYTSSIHGREKELSDEAWELRLELSACLELSPELFPESAKLKRPAAAPKGLVPARDLWLWLRRNEASLAELLRHGHVVVAGGFLTLRQHEALQGLFKRK